MRAMPLRYLAVVVALLATRAPQTFQLSTIDATGAARLSAADVVKVSGLKVGQSVTQADLDAVTARMAECGLFKNVSYKFSTKVGLIGLTFAVEEQPWDTPVLYDNFVGISDDELTKAIQAEVPTYDGTAPSNGIVPLISHALESVLTAHGIAGTIDHKALIGGTNIAGRANVFSIHPGPVLCAIHLDGAAHVPEAEVLITAKPDINAEYSRRKMESLVRTSFLQSYQEHGYWKASLTSPVAAVGTAGACQGIVATVHVDEGTTYNWDRVEWTGNTVLTTKELNGILALKAGVLAESRKLEQGLFSVEVAHRKLGYLTVRARYEAVLDDAARAVTAKVTVAEGPQFLMGTVSFVGVSPAEAKALAGQWKLQAGQPFDDTYPAQFSTASLGAYRPPHAFATTRTMNPTTHVVDVTFTMR
jgi:outer membrane protein assembly factor BamA